MFSSVLNHRVPAHGASTPVRMTSLWPKWLAVLAAFLMLFSLPAILEVAPALTQPRLAQMESLALSFVPNVGQTDSAAYFEVRDMGGTTFFAAGETVLILPTSVRETSVVHVRFEGSNPAANVVGVDRLPGISNYFIGSDSARWRTNIPTYAGIVYEQLYPGIDLRYDGTKGRLKSSFVVSPGADPSLILWRHKGATGVQVDPTTGNLMVDLGNSTLVEETPIAWQTKGGRKVMVALTWLSAQ